MPVERKEHHRKYILVFLPQHHRADCRGYVREHVLVASRAIGIELPTGAVVHHHDGNGKNNSNANLVVCENQSYHLLLHSRQRALMASGHTDYRICKFCHKWDHPSRLLFNKRKSPYSPTAYHSHCKREYRRIKSG